MSRRCFEDLRAISLRSAALLQGRELLTEDDLYDENGLAGVIVVDSSALIAILRREPEVDRFLRIVAEADGCLVSAVSVLEARMVLAGRTGDEAVGRS